MTLATSLAAAALIALGLAPVCAAGVRDRDGPAAVAQVAALPGYLADAAVRAAPGPEPEPAFRALPRPPVGPAGAPAATLADLVREHAWRQATARRLDRFFGAGRRPTAARP